MQQRNDSDNANGSTISIKGSLRESAIIRRLVLPLFRHKALLIDGTLLSHRAMQRSRQRLSTYNLHHWHSEAGLKPTLACAHYDELQGSDIAAMCRTACQLVTVAAQCTRACRGSSGSSASGAVDVCAAHTACMRSGT
eukprot:7019-Heterococcus_DN1.PRE.8